MECEAQEEQEATRAEALLQEVAATKAGPIARDGAGAVELGLRLRAALAHIARLRPAADLVHGSMGEAAAATARDALDRARAALKSPADLAEVEAAAAHLLGQHPAQNA